MDRHLYPDFADEASKELARTRALANVRELAVFARTPTTWELALLIYINDNLNISSAIASLENRGLSYSSLVRFVQEQLSQGTLVSKQGAKKSEKVLALSPSVQQELADYLSKAHQLGSGAGS